MYGMYFSSFISSFFRCAFGNIVSFSFCLVDHFHMTLLVLLFSVAVQTHGALVAYDSKWVTSALHSAYLTIHRSGVRTRTLLFGCNMYHCMAGFALLLLCTLMTCYCQCVYSFECCQNHASSYLFSFDTWQLRYRSVDATRKLKSHPLIWPFSARWSILMFP